jgi:hypothetical protein
LGAFHARAVCMHVNKHVVWSCSRTGTRAELPEAAISMHV